MRKSVLLILGIIIGALAMYFYFHNYKPTEGMTDTPTPNGIIGPETIKELTEAYNPRYDTISKMFFRDIKGGDNRSSWYSLEDLENFIALAKEQADTLGYTMNGVRLYLGKNKPIDKLPGYSTMLFVPTGHLNTSEGNMLNLARQESNDIPGANGLDKGTSGQPPGANYPQ